MTLDRPSYLRLIADMVRVWDMHISKPWTMPAERNPAGFATIFGCASHAVTLSRSVLLLYANGQEVAAMPAIRSTMELAVTAAWLSQSDDSAEGWQWNSANERRKLLEGITQHGLADVGAAAEANKAVLDAYKGTETEEARVIRKRFEALEGGAALYVSYRAASALCHPGSFLTDIYLEPTEPQEGSPFPIAFREEPDFDNADAWLGVHATMLLLALTAADISLASPHHRTQLEKWAKRLGVGNEISLVTPA